MYNGDYSRKKNLVDFGFRLPSALDNRPLKFEEFEGKMGKVLFVSATPAEYELEKSGPPVELITRPTGLLDPEVEIRPIEGQMQHLMAEAKKTIKRGDRILSHDPNQADGGGPCRLPCLRKASGFGTCIRTFKV